MNVETRNQRAYEILKELNSITPLSDMCYDIRDRECLGWDGPLVTRWGSACSEMLKLFEEPK